MTLIFKNNIKHLLPYYKDFNFFKTEKTITQKKTLKYHAYVKHLIQITNFFSILLVFSVLFVNIYIILFYAIKSIP